MAQATVSGVAPTTGHSLIVGRSGKNIAGGSSIVYDSSSKLVIGLPKRGKGVVVEKNIYLPLGFIHLKVIMKNIGVDICCAYLEIYCRCCSLCILFSGAAYCNLHALLY